MCPACSRLWKRGPLGRTSFCGEAKARTPGPANRNYGYNNWFLNTEQKPLPAAPASSVMFQGNRANIIYIDWDNDVVVVRWIRGDALYGFIGMVLDSLAGN